MQEVNSKKLIKILYSSFYISHYADQELSIAALSIDLFKLQGVYQDEWDKSLKEFDGYTIDDIEKNTFQRRQTRLKNKLDKLVKHFRSNAPKPQKGGGAGTEQVDINDDGIENPIILKWYKRYSLLGGKEYFQFPKEDLQEAQEKLQEIARYQIKLDAMEEVSEVASLEGSFTYSQKFETVAGACRWLSLNNEGLTFKEILEEVRSDRIVIEKDGIEVSDNQKIYNRAYSWWQNQRNKGVKIPKE